MNWDLNAKASSDSICGWADVAMETSLAAGLFVTGAGAKRPGLLVNSQAPASVEMEKFGTSILGCSVLVAVLQEDYLQTSQQETS